MIEFHCVTVDDNSCCVAFLKKYAPELIELMPVSAMTAPEGKSTVVTKQIFHESTKTGGAVVYFGAGAPEDDNGWQITLFPARTLEECAMRYKLIIAVLAKAIGA